MCVLVAIGVQPNSNGNADRVDLADFRRSNPCTSAQSASSAFPLVLHLRCLRCGKVAYFRTLLFNRGVKELTRSFAEFFLVLRNLPPSVVGVGPPGRVLLESSIFFNRDERS